MAEQEDQSSRLPLVSAEEAQISIDMVCEVLQNTYEDSRFNPLILIPCLYWISCVSIRLMMEMVV